MKPLFQELPFPIDSHIHFYVEYLPHFSSVRFFEPNLIRLPEMNNIRELIERSRRGIKFVGSVWGELEVFESLTFKSPLSTDMAFWGRKKLVPC